MEINNLLFTLLFGSLNCNFQNNENIDTILRTAFNTGIYVQQQVVRWVCSFSVKTITKY